MKTTLKKKILGFCKVDIKIDENMFQLQKPLR